MSVPAPVLHFNRYQGGEVWRAKCKLGRILQAWGLAVRKVADLRESGRSPIELRSAELKERILYRQKAQARLELNAAIERNKRGQ